MYIPDQFIRNLSPQRSPDRQQRAMDEQVGLVAAAITRPARRLALRIHSLSARTAARSPSRASFENHAAISSTDRPARPR
jgi:hypothetical protein